MKRMLKDIDALIFDMDGTLIDSMWVWVTIDEEYLGKYHLEEPKNFHENIAGKSFREVAQYYKEIFPTLMQSVEEIMDEWHEMAYEKYMHEVPLKKGAQAFIEEMRAQGKKIGIATSNSRKLAEDTLKSLGVFHLFDSICIAEEAGAGKPAPDVYLQVAQKLDVLPERCLAFEDIPAGLMAGKNAGMKTCAIEDRFSCEFLDKKRELADYYIQDYDEIEKGNYEILS